MATQAGIWMVAWLAMAGAGAADEAPDPSGRITPGVNRLPIDPTLAAQQGIRLLRGKHIAFFTDLPSSPELDALPEVFDQAFPQWCRYFGVSAEAHAAWQVNGSLMKDKGPFQRAGLLPPDVPSFPNGYSRNYDLWLFEQDTDYYRRELFLHEGTHSFMRTLLGACGPPWYMEGMAELMGTHRWHDGKLTLNYLPQSRDEAPGWGRVKLVQDAVAQHRAKRLREVIEFNDRAHRQTEPYAWCWAATLLLDRHPRYRERFRQLIGHVQDPDFNAEFYRLFAPDWEQLCEEWQLMVADLQYGQDIVRAAIDFAAGKPLPPDGATVKIAADRGWQSSRWQLTAGVRYRLKATGRYQLAQRPEVWWCEPGGVSIHYHQGMPLGILLSAVRPDHLAADASTPLLRPITVGLGTTFTPAESGTLYLKINDSPGQLFDAAGELTVEITAISGG